VIEPSPAMTRAFPTAKLIKLMELGHGSGKSFEAAFAP
jgi:hypothetical protein